MGYKRLGLLISLPLGQYYITILNAATNADANIFKANASPAGTKPGFVLGIFKAIGVNAYVAMEEKGRRTQKNGTPRDRR